MSKGVKSYKVLAPVLYKLFYDIFMYTILGHRKAFRMWFWPRAYTCFVGERYVVWGVKVSVMDIHLSPTQYAHTLLAKTKSVMPSFAL